MLDALTLDRRAATDRTMMLRTCFHFGVPAAFRLLANKRSEVRAFAANDPRTYRLDSDFRRLIDSVDVDNADAAGLLTPRELEALRYMLEPAHNIGHIAASLSYSGERLQKAYFALSQADIERLCRSEGWV